MAKNLKGITIDIGGNTEPLEKSLSSVNKTSRTLQVELRQVEKLLKLDPTNTELLVQKQNLLADSISSTSEKLDALKAAEAQVQAQFERGEIAEEQYREFQREIIKTENELKNMKSALQVATRNLNEFGDNNGVAKEEAEKLNKTIKEQNEALEAEKEALKQAEKAQKQHADEVENAKKELDDFKNSVEDVANKVKVGALAIGTAGVAGATYALNLSNNFDKAFNTLITKTGAAEEEFNSLDEAMERVYANNFGESIEDVANSMATVKNNTKLAGDELQIATERALLLRDTFEFEVNESTRSAKMLMDQFGLSSDEAYNLIVQGAQNGLDKNGDLLDTINEYSVHFNQLGIGAEEMFNMLINGAENGTFSVDKLGDAVKEFGIRVKDGTADDAFKELGLSVDVTKEKFGAGGAAAKEALEQVTTALFNMDDPIQQNLLGVTMFGTMWEDLGVDGVKALVDMQGEISTTSTALEDINNQKYDDIGSAISGLGRQLQVEIVEPLGEELKPVVEAAISYVQENGPEIKEILRGIVEKIGEFVSFIVNNSSTIISTIVGISTGLLAWNVASIIQGVVGAIKAFKLANEGATIAQWAMNAAMNANPIGLIVSIIAGLVAAVIALWTTNEDFRNAVIEIWNNIKEVGIACWEAICTFFTETIPNAWNSLVTWLQGIPEWFGELWENVLAKFEEWGNNVSNFFTNTIPQWIENVFNWFNELPYKIGYALGYVLASIVQWGVDTWNYLATNVPIWISNVVTFFSQLPGQIWNWLVNAYNNVVSWGSNMFSKAIEVGSNFISNIITWVQQLPGRFSTWLNDTISKVGSFASNLGSRALQAGQNMVNNIVNAVKNLPSKMKEIGKNIVEGVWNGITGMGSWISSKVSGFFSGIVDGAKKALGIHSPSRVFKDQVGKYIAEGVGVGIEENSSGVMDQVRKMNDGILDESKNIDLVSLNRTIDNTITYKTPNITTNESSMSNRNTPENAIFQIIADGQVLAEVVTPYQDVMNGGRLQLAGRGLVLP
ncbi:phage tail tape measure protein [uncultured Clostridium sp.]|uniref:phage tail tape measure protein n=1 Tax=uncultured Clostridium sp. TaxID=59620 RepID=UPI002673E42E|nr:phage tail tape measure protein [uncultured Clostridium sp.]